MKGWRWGVVAVGMLLLLAALGFWLANRQAPCVTVNALRDSYGLNRAEDRYNPNKPTAAEVMPGDVLERYRRAAVACSRSLR